MKKGRPEAARMSMLACSGLSRQEIESLGMGSPTTLRRLGKHLPRPAKTRAMIAFAGKGFVKAAIVSANMTMMNTYDYLWHPF